MGDINQKKESAESNPNLLAWSMFFSVALQHREWSFSILNDYKVSDCSPGCVHACALRVSMFWPPRPSLYYFGPHVRAILSKPYNSTLFAGLLSTLWVHNWTVKSLMIILPWKTVCIWLENIKDNILSCVKTAPIWNWIKGTFPSQINAVSRYNLCCIICLEYWW